MPPAYVKPYLKRQKNDAANGQSRVPDKFADACF
jgi:hypothetical protein